MKKILFFIAFLFAATNSFAQTSTYVSGYTNSKGNYVQGYYRTAPNSARNDNYSTVGNTNPYTGTSWTQPRDGYRTTITNSEYYRSPATFTASSYVELTYSNTYTPTSYSAPISTYSSPSYSSSKTVYTGSRGGQYYINSNGNRAYVSRN